MNMGSVEAVLRSLPGYREPLLKISLYNITPALVGGWTGEPHIKNLFVEYVRPTDIAGKTRWWLRSILAAGIYETLGRHPPLWLADEIASRLMGTAGQGPSMASKIVIRVEPSPCNSRCMPLIPVPIGVEKLDEYALSEFEYAGFPVDPHYGSGEYLKAALSSSRVKLQNLGRKCSGEAVVPLPPGFYRFKLLVLERSGVRLTELEQRLLGLALGMAVFFTGIGRMTTRGYGKLDIDGGDAVLDSPLAEEFMYVRDKLENGCAEDIAERSAELAGKYIRDWLVCDSKGCKQFLSLLERTEAFTCSAPLIETLHPEYTVWRRLCRERIVLRRVERNCIRCIECKGNPWCIVAAICEAVKKVSIKHQILGRCSHGSGLGILSFPLGLPRDVRLRLRRGNLSISVRVSCGSKLSKRLQSQLHFGATRNYIYMLGFKTAFSINLGLINCNEKRREIALAPYGISFYSQDAKDIVNCILEIARFRHARYHRDDVQRELDVLSGCKYSALLDFLMDYIYNWLRG